MTPGGLAGQANARESQVAAQFNRLGSAAKSLHENISNLDDRLSPILRGSGPSASDGRKPEGKDVLVHHAEQMSNFADLIENANRRIEEILSRLEL